MSKRSPREQRVIDLLGCTEQKCRVEIQRERDSDLLCDLLIECRRWNHVNRERVVRDRIRQVMDAAPEKA